MRNTAVLPLIANSVLARNSCNNIDAQNFGGLYSPALKPTSAVTARGCRRMSDSAWWPQCFMGNQVVEILLFLSENSQFESSSKKKDVYISGIHRIIIHCIKTATCASMQLAIGWTLTTKFFWNLLMLKLWSLHLAESPLISCFCKVFWGVLGKARPPNFADSVPFEFRCVQSALRCCAAQTFPQLLLSIIK